MIPLCVFFSTSCQQPLTLSQFCHVTSSLVVVFGGQRTGSDMDKDIKQMDQNLADLGVGMYMYIDLLHVLL